MPRATLQHGNGRIVAGAIRAGEVGLYQVPRPDKQGPVVVLTRGQRHSAIYPCGEANLPAVWMKLSGKCQESLANSCASAAISGGSAEPSQAFSVQVLRSSAVVRRRPWC